MMENKEKKIPAIKRIRYVKTNEEGILKSKRNLYGTKHGGYYSVTLDTNNMKFIIKNVSTRNTYHSDRDYGLKITNLNVLKRNVQKYLKEKFGVAIDHEIRQVENRISPAKKKI